jgi:hypothetical protein
MAAWWPAVDARQIVILDAQLVASTLPVEAHTLNGRGQFVLCRGTETWTGVEGPALYANAGAADVTVEQALARQGADIRRQFHAPELRRTRP